ncbi:MAG: nuclear transport factor 2 family protein [Pigmentiphaga sp.]
MGKQSKLEVCTQLSNQFFYYLDEFEYGKMIAMMRPNARWFRQGKTLSGHDAIREALHQRSSTQRIRHIVTNGFIEHEEAEKIHYLAYMLGYRYDDGTRCAPPLPINGPVRMLLVDMTFLRTPEHGWLIDDLKAIPEFEFPVLSVNY